MHGDVVGGRIVMRVYFALPSLLWCIDMLGVCLVAAGKRLGRFMARG